PRHPARPERADDLGEHRLLVRGLQRQEGRPHAAAGEHGAGPQAGEAEAQPALGDEADAAEVPVVAVVPRLGVLGSGAEVGSANELKRARAAGMGGPLILWDMTPILSGQDRNHVPREKRTATFVPPTCAE